MLVVTPNTCIDVTTWLPALVPGSVSRGTRTEVTAGGKGVNVIRTLTALGRAPTLVGLRKVVVSETGSLVATIQQPPEQTRFGLERGCYLRLKILK